MSNVIEYDALAGTVVEREYTEAEVAQAKADAEAAKKAKAAAAKAEKAAAEALAAAIEHAKSLGFTDAMIAVMYPNLGAQSE